MAQQTTLAPNLTLFFYGTCLYRKTVLGGSNKGLKIEEKLKIINYEYKGEWLLESYYKVQILVRLAEVLI